MTTQALSQPPADMGLMAHVAFTVQKKSPGIYSNTRREQRAPVPGLQQSVKHQRGKESWGTHRAQLPSPSPKPSPGGE